MSERHHISDCDFDRYHFDAVRGLELAVIEEHLLWCFHCQRREEENLAQHPGETAGTSHGPHLDRRSGTLQVGSHDRRPGPAGIEQHMSECQQCADRMLAIDRFISLVRAGVIRRDSLPSFPVGNSAQVTPNRL
jgi:hypothetical protein